MQDQVSGKDGHQSYQGESIDPCDSHGAVRETYQRGHYRPSAVNDHVHVTDGLTLAFEAAIQEDVPALLVLVGGVVHGFVSAGEALRSRKQGQEYVEEGQRPPRDAMLLSF